MPEYSLQLHRGPPCIQWPKQSIPQHVIQVYRTILELLIVADVFGTPHWTVTEIAPQSLQQFGNSLID